MTVYSQIGGRVTRWRSPSVLSRLPEHYYRHRQQVEKPGTRVHDEPKQGDVLNYKVVDKETLRVERLTDTPLNVVYPPESHQGLWGGEGIIKGFVKYRTFYGRLSAKLWFPHLLKTTVYSEVLDKYLSVMVTDRTLQLIDQHQGFDNYILKSPVEDLKSDLGLGLKRKMLMALATKDFHHDDPKKQDFVSSKYKDCTIPLEEAEWVGLPEYKGVTLLKLKEATRPKPLKVLFTEQLIQKFKGDQTKES